MRARGAAMLCARTRHDAAGHDLAASSVRAIGDDPPWRCLP
jgi:hypothetical protein